MSRPLKDRRHEVETCAFCPKLCRFACPVAEAETRETVTPWGLMTRLDSLSRAGAQVDADLGELLSHCTSCGRCVEICKHSNDVPGTLLAARATAQRAGVLPVQLKTWAETAPESNPTYEALPVTGAVRVLPGYTDEAELKAALVLLRAAGYSEIGRLDGPLDAGNRWTAAGRPEAAEARARTVAEAVGRGQLICLDPEDVIALRPLLGRAVKHLVEALEGRLPALAEAQGRVLYLDSCRVGRGLGLVDAPRLALEGVVTGIDEAVMSGVEGGCCGARAGYDQTAPRDAAMAAQEFVDGSPLPVIIADCACAAHLKAHGENPVTTWAQALAAGLFLSRKSAEKTP